VGEFGNKFRKEREKQGISLEEISGATKIGTRMLLAIEDEQFDRLPGGIFNKGFIRAYAKHLGLNEDQAVADYLACLRSQLESQEVRDSQAVAAAPATQPQNGLGRRAKKSTPEVEELPHLQLPRPEHVRPPRRDYPRLRERSVPWPILALAVLVAILAVQLWYRHTRNSQLQTAAAPATTSATPPSPQPPSPTEQATNLTPVASSSASSPAGAKTATAKPPSILSVPVARPVKVAPPQPAAPSAPTSEEKTGNSEIEQFPTQASQAANAPANPESATPPAPLILVIRASENSWVSVTADGRSVLNELLIAPAHASIRAGREIVLRVGNAGGVTFLWNGQELPAQGNEAEVKTLVFDAEGMRVVAPSQPQDQNR